MKYKFIHLSDIHFVTDRNEQAERLLRGIAKDILENTTIDENSWLFITGDLVDSGSDVLSFNSVYDLIEELCVKIGMPKENRLCIPGNHDVDRSALANELPFLKPILDTISSETSFNDQTVGLVDRFLKPVFANYNALSNRVMVQAADEYSIAGFGAALNPEIGIYCANSALTSFAGLKGSDGATISDYGKLQLNTRIIYKWLAETDFKTRILLIHHQPEWFCDWARIELGNLISASFDLVFSGHEHTARNLIQTRFGRNPITINAPALFAKENVSLGYSITTLETDSRITSVKYRQWDSDVGQFVKGTTYSHNDTGEIVFDAKTTVNIAESLGAAGLEKNNSLIDNLWMEYRSVVSMYSGEFDLWTSRDFAAVPESERKIGKEESLYDEMELIRDGRSIVITAPAQFGLSSLGRRIAWQRFKDKGDLLLYVDAKVAPNHVNGLRPFINKIMSELCAKDVPVVGFIVDNFTFDKSQRKLLTSLLQIIGKPKLLILHAVEDFGDLANPFAATLREEFGQIDELFLWALSRNGVRCLIGKYLDGRSSLDEASVTKKVLSDLDTLNMHRTPANCLLLVKLCEGTFEESPVNRTEVIGRVLQLLFWQYEGIPRYASRPDLQDCQYALGYFCEFLIRNGKSQFSKLEFDGEITRYCEQQIVDVDAAVLFTFLHFQRIIVPSGGIFEFRFIYWMYYFAAHRMHHNKVFCEYILSEGRYAMMPELIEFYTGIDRRRENAVDVVSKDLSSFLDEFWTRSGFPRDFDPMSSARWAPTEDTLNKLEAEVKEGFLQSSVPASVKDAVADSNYDRSKPYRQELAQFLKDSSLNKMNTAMSGAARVLRNSDYVCPEKRVKLLEIILECWSTNCRLLAYLSPVLAGEQVVQYEDVSFYLDESFNRFRTDAARWNQIMNSILHNVVSWYQEDIYSKKLGPLYYRKNSEGGDGLSSALIIQLIARHRPQGWVGEIEKYIKHANKNSFYMARLFSSLRREYAFSFATEKDMQQIRRLAAMCIAKHKTGATLPGPKQVEKLARRVFDDGPKSPKSGPNKFFR